MDALLEGCLRFWEMLQKQDAWVYQVFFVVFATLIAHHFVRRFLDLLLRRAGVTKNLWDDALVESAARPLALLVLVLGLAWAVDIIHTVSQQPLFAMIDPAREVAVILLLTWFVLRFIKRAEHLLIDPPDEREPIDATTAHALSKLLRLAVMITASLVALQTLGFSISGVLAFGGIGGIAVGFAARDLLANFFGGLMVYLDRPFKVGDWIRSPDKQIEGVVEQIGWRQTRIRTFDKRPLYVPNATFTSISVENPSRMQNRRIYETIGLRYKDARVVRPIIAEIHQYLAGHAEIDGNQTLIVNFNSFGASSLDFFIYCFTHTTNWVQFHQIKQEVLLDIMDIIHRHGADVAFPTTTLDLPEALAQMGAAAV